MKTVRMSLLGTLTAVSALCALPLVSHHAKADYPMGQCCVTTNDCIPYPWLCPDGYMDCDWWYWPPCSDGPGTCMCITW